MRSDGNGSSGAANTSSGPPQAFHVDSHASSASHVPVTDASPSSDFITRLEILSTKIPNFYIAPFCGASAGVASGIVTCPLDVIKTKLQAQGGFARRGGQAVEPKAVYRGMLGTGKMIVREDGLRGLYQGLGPMLLGYLPTWAVYLAIYDRSREYFYEHTGWSSVFSTSDCTILTRLQIAGGFLAAMHQSPPVPVRQSSQIPSGSSRQGSCHRASNRTARGRGLHGNTPAHGTLLGKCIKLKAFAHSILVSRPLFWD